MTVHMQDFLASFSPSSSPHVGVKSYATCADLRSMYSRQQRAWNTYLSRMYTMTWPHYPTGPRHTARTFQSQIHDIRGLLNINAMHLKRFVAQFPGRTLKVPMASEKVGVPVTEMVIFLQVTLESIKFMRSNAAEHCTSTIPSSNFTGCKIITEQSSYEQ